MSGLGDLAVEYNVPIQSHLSENHGEIEWVHSLHPDSSSYTDVYCEHRLMGTVPTVMAHCIHLSDEEMERMHETKTMVAHCPYSNVNLSSGIAPIRKLLNHGISIALGSDISGGHDISMAKVLTEAVGLSKMKWAEVDASYASLTLPEAFYMATKGGGQFFGDVGSFETGYEFDALVIDDHELFDPNERSIEERLERWLYIGDDRHIVGRYVAGKLLDEPPMAM
jgi:guanine deaminase